MGWKTVKEHYQIGHTVQVTEDGELCIGSPYIHDIIKFTPEGEFIKMYKNSKYDDGWNINEDLKRYQEEIIGDLDLFKKLLKQKDTFTDSLPVYTYHWKTGEVSKKMCEAYGWPNVTHDGMMMHDNTHSVDKEEVLRWAVESTSCRLNHLKQRADEIEQKLLLIRTDIGDAKQWHKNASSDLILFTSDINPITIETDQPF